MMTLEDIRIVLVETSHPGNIGSTARAMKTMGLKSLYLVSPRTFPHQQAIDLSAGADDVLAGAIVTNTLDEALIGCQLIIATSARPRGISIPGFNPRSAAQFISGQQKGTQVAIIFGREASGLTNEEILKCHYHMNIPSNPEYSSLNLAQAVQIMTYELRMELLNPKESVALRQDELASAEAIEQFYKHLEEVFIDIQFLKLQAPRRLMQRVRRLFNRVQLETMEVNILRGMLSQVQKSLQWARNQ